MADRKGNLLLLLLLLLPLGAFAHGEEILETVFLQISSFFLFLVTVLLIRISYAKKALLVTIYLLATFLVWRLTDEWPYYDTRRLINVLVGAVPLGSTLVAYGLLMVIQKAKEG
ncbi:hypothetical protein [Hymenobacter cavernae]|uniref:Uncharacterized protein n=1 Tax=Hymenobacter cavernae TaxID=2044852 RepID=A0ABQ1U4A2_9BACT|nr:hypothetical protein [Hymenobacter cavernae]GGF09817.1 hypothetical protein GCM10011383_21280 [Hymenobacter cavernae]